MLQVSPICRQTSCWGTVWSSGNGGYTWVEVDLFASEERAYCPLWFSPLIPAPLRPDTLTKAWLGLRLALPGVVFGPDCSPWSRNHWECLGLLLLGGCMPLNGELLPLGADHMMRIQLTDQWVQCCSICINLTQRLDPYLGNKVHMLHNPRP